MEQHEAKGRMLFRLGNVTYLLVGNLFKFKDLVAKQQPTNFCTPAYKHVHTHTHTHTGSQFLLHTGRERGSLQGPVKNRRRLLPQKPEHTDASSPQCSRSDGGAMLHTIPKRQRKPANVDSTTHWTAGIGRV